MAFDINTKTGKITGVIRLKRDLTDKEIFYFNELCIGLSGDYFYIIHDKDVDENGSLLPRHLHYVIESKNRKLLSTWLNLITDALKLPNSNGLEIEHTDRFIGSVQYLTHQNYKNKAQYEKSLIKTNVKDEQLDNILSMNRGGLDMDYLIFIVQTSNSILDIMISLGLNYYHIYRATILDIAKAFKKDFVNDKGYKSKHVPISMTEEEKDDYE